jgi:anaerobic magnesium-protoporphyrin IX monomethyl ester cyclase
MKILLTTLHAKYVHNSLALPCLAAACEGVEGATAIIREFTINEPSDRVLTAIVNEDAEVVAFSCYIWNIEQTLKFAHDLKQLRPETIIVLGGPEVSYGAFDLMMRHPSVDFVVRGEGEETFRDYIARFVETYPELPTAATLLEMEGLFIRMDGEITATGERRPIPELDTIPSPFRQGLADLSKPLVYYESSRGCPFSCAFCMSSLERGVRYFSTERVRSDIAILMAEKVGTIKFVDRTFNCDPARANAIWDFILAGNRSSRFHFEVAADLLTEENFQMLKRVPAGIFRFEIGVQSGENDTLVRVGRKSDLARLSKNVRRLREETGVVVHLDLVAGLPGEDFTGFLRSLQLLFDLLNDKRTTRMGEACLAHIQVEILKVLKGSPMRKIADELGYAYSASPPYRVLRTPWLSYREICRIETIARLVDLFFNSGRFTRALMQIARSQPLSTFFARAAEYWQRMEVAANLSQAALFEALWRCAGESMDGLEMDEFRDALCYDFCMAEYPSSARLPSFFGGVGKSGNTRERTAGLPERLEVPSGSRVRTFSRVFGRDCRSWPWKEGEVEILFVYISTPGKGLTIEALDMGSSF